MPSPPFRWFERGDYHDGEVSGVNKGWNATPGGHFATPGRSGPGAGRSGVTDRVGLSTEGRAPNLGSTSHAVTLALPTRATPHPGHLLPSQRSVPVPQLPAHWQ